MDVGGVEEAEAGHADTLTRELKRAKSVLEDGLDEARQPTLCRIDG